MNKKSWPLMLREAILLFTILGFSSQVTGQNNPYDEVSIASPNAASLGKFVDFPVSYHTGTPQINLPIYTIIEGSLSLPISLSYHASGLKVMETASWVGAGWSLNAGGVITRSVQGAPDEKATGSAYNTHGHFSDGGFNSYLHTQDDIQDWMAFANGAKDGEPDLFFFNFGGYSGKFYFRDDRSVVLVPEQDVRIEPFYDEVDGESIEGFKLTTPDGVIHHFGKTSDADVDPIEKTYPLTENTGLSYSKVISSWYLSKITTQDELFEINLSYEAEKYSYWTISMFPIPFDNQASQNPFPDLNNPYGYNLVQNFVDGVRLSQISSSHVTINFNGGDLRTDLGEGLTSPSMVDNVNLDARSLGSITISNAGQTLCKEFLFSYSYFEDNVTSLKGDLARFNIQTDRKRLRLDSFREKACNSSITNPPYVFKYYNELVARRLTFAQDHWGFFNGVVANKSLIPSYTLNTFTTVLGANRDANWPAMRGGALKQIVYPTGGNTQFELEPNKTWVNYSKLVENEKFSMSMGYDGSTSTVIRNESLSSNDYKVRLVNNLYGGYSVLNIFNGSNVLVKSVSANLGQTAEEVVSLPSDNYRFELFKDSPSTGNGTQALFYEFIPVTVQKNEIVGGLRVKTITHHDAATQNDMVTSYSYESNGMSTGILYSRPSYVQIVRNDLIRDVGYYTLDENQTEPSCSPYGCITCGSSLYYISPSSVQPMRTSQGNHIGYNEVKVSQAGNGYSIYRYYGSDIWDQVNDDVAYRKVNTEICDSNSPNFPPAPLQEEFMRGELKYEGIFDESGQLIKETEYYPTYEANPLKIPAFIVTWSASKLLGTRYEISTSKKKQIQTIEKTRQPNGEILSISKQAYFGSSHHNQVTRTSIQNSANVLEESKSKYAFDFEIPDCALIPICLNDLEYDNNSCYDNYVATSAGCSNQSCRHSAWQVYVKCLSTSRIDFLDCQSNYKVAYENCFQSFKASADQDLKAILELQAGFRNPIIESSNWVNNRLTDATYNRYGYSIDPSKVYPVESSFIPLNIPATSVTEAGNTNTTVIRDNRYISNSNYKYKDGHLIEITTIDGITVSYYWGYNNTLPIIKAVGVDFLTLSTAYTQAGGNIETIRSTLSGAQITSYIHDPAVGVVSTTDPNGTTNYYEYDGLGRLVLIKDTNHQKLSQFKYNFKIKD